MRAFLLLMVSVTVLFGFACSDNSSGPDNTGNGTEPAVTETIGTAGGTVAADNILLTVPAGSFSADVSVGITETTEDNYGDNAASNTYMLTGIPDDFSAPLTLTIAYTGELANETFVVVEQRAVDPFTEETERIPQFVPATVTGDSVTAVLPPRTLILGKDAATTTDKDQLEFFITLVTDFVTEESASHFCMRVPKYMDEFVSALAPRMDEVYERMESIGFDFSISGSTYGAIDTVFVYSDENVVDPPVFSNLIYISDTEYIPMMKIYKYSASLSNLDMVSFDATRAIATLAALYYSGHDRRPTLWFDIAMSDWLAREWHDTGVPESSVTGEPTLALEGMFVPEETSLENIGDLLAKSRHFTPLIDYFDSRYNFTGSEQTLARIYEERYNGADMATSIETVTGLESTEWWPDFVEHYITGQVWNADPAVFLEGSTQKGQITLSENDSTHYFNGEFGDLAADIYQITLDDSYAEKISTLRFIAESPGLQDEYLSVLLFGVKNDKPYYIGRGIDTIIADAGIASDNNTFLAVVTGSLIEYPYRDDVSYSLTVTGAYKTDTFSQIVLQLPYVWSDYEWVDNDGSTRSAGGAGTMFTWTLNVEDAAKTGNVYTGTTVSSMNNDSWGHYTTSSTITATISDSEASASITQITENYDDDTTTTHTFDFWSLPLITPAEGFTASYGSTLEEYLAEEKWPNFTYTYRYEANADPEGYTREAEYYARGANIHLR